MVDLRAFMARVFKYEIHFNLDALQSLSGLRSTSNNSLAKSFDQKIFKAWCDGETENDFVNANMIELKQQLGCQTEAGKTLQVILFTP